MKLRGDVANALDLWFESESTHHHPLTLHARRPCRTVDDLVYEVERLSPPRTCLVEISEVYVSYARQAGSIIGLGCFRCEDSNGERSRWLRESGARLARHLKALLEFPERWAWRSDPMRLWPAVNGLARRR